MRDGCSKGKLTAIVIVNPSEPSQSHLLEVADAIDMRTASASGSAQSGQEQGRKNQDDSQDK